MWDDVEVLTIEQAIAHARLPETQEGEDLQMKLRQAHDLVLDHISRTDDEDWTDTMLAWTPDTVPKTIQAAVQRQFLDLVRYRGDDDPSKGNPLGLSPWVRQLLQRYHDPALA